MGLALFLRLRIYITFANMNYYSLANMHYKQKSSLHRYDILNSKDSLTGQEKKTEKIKDFSWYILTLKSLMKKDGSKKPDRKNRRRFKNCHVVISKSYEEATRFKDDVVKVQ